jgi:UDP-2,3-diacylglucosamine hydrolase
MATSGQSVFFISDMHLGVPSHEASLQREKKLVLWLDEIADRAQAIHLVGDLFDFWFEYKEVVPKGYIRFLGKLAELRDRGIDIHVYTGNHDIWMFGYLTDEMGIALHREGQNWLYGDCRIHVGHGDGIGPGDHGYKFIKKVFSNKVCQWMFRQIHPDFGIRLALFWSRKSRQADAHIDESFKGEEEAQVVFAREYLEKEDIDFFVFGHRHWPTDYALNDKSRFINLGDWITHFTYAEFDGKDMHLKHWQQDQAD